VERNNRVGSQVKTHLIVTIAQFFKELH